MSPYLIPDLKSDEGCKLTAYPDPLSGGDPWTIGYGQTGPNIHKGVVWTQDQADAALVKQTSAVASMLMELLPWFTSLSPLRQDVLINMGYQLGVSGLMTFKQTLKCVQTGAYEQAANGMLNSLWAQQTPNRAKRLADQMRTDTHT